MSRLTNSPFLFFGISLVALWLAAWFGAEVLGRYVTRRGERREVVSIAFFLIADIDSPSGGGVIHIVPRNLVSLSETMH